MKIDEKALEAAWHIYDSCDGHVPEDRADLEQFVWGMIEAYEAALMQYGIVAGQPEKNKPPIGGTVKCVDAGGGPLAARARRCSDYTTSQP